MASTVTRGEPMRRAAALNAAALLAVALLAATGSRAAAAPTVTGRWISGASPFPAECSGAVGAFRGTEVEPHVAMDPSDPDRVVAVWQQDRFESHGGAQSNVTAYSHDGGTTWNRVLVPGISRCTGGPWQRATDPWLSIGPDGVVYLASLSMDGQLSITWRRNALVVNRSEDGGKTWSDPAVVVDDPAIILNDKEAITADPNVPGTVYLVYARAFGIKLITYFSKSTDGGRTWLAPLPLFGTIGIVSAQGNELLVLPDGTLVVVYTDTTAMDVKAVRSTDGGLTWSQPALVGSMTARSVIAPGGSNVRSSEFLPSADIGPDGSVVVAWQDVRSFIEGDITFSRSTDGGATWSEPVAAATVPSQPFSPAIAVADDGTIGIVYYDFRNDQPDDGRADTDVWFSWSHDDGITWEETHVAGSFDIRRAPFASGYFLGDYIGLEAGGSTFQGIIPMSPPTGTSTRTDIWSATIRF